MLDVRIPIGQLFVILGALLFLYGLVFSEPVPFYTPNAWFPLKLNQPVGAFMFVFGVIMLVLARFMKLHTIDRELAQREKELAKAERKRQRALAKRGLAGAGQKSEAEGEAGESNLPDKSVVGESAGVYHSVESNQGAESEDTDESDDSEPDDAEPDADDAEPDDSPQDGDAGKSK